MPTQAVHATPHGSLINGLRKQVGFCLSSTPCECTCNNLKPTHHATPKTSCQIHNPMAHAGFHAKCIITISHAKSLVPKVCSHLCASACASAWWLDPCCKPAPKDWCLLCLTGLTCLALAATKLVGSLTIPRGAGVGPVRARRLPGLPCAAARPGWGPSQGLLLSMSIESPAWGRPGWGSPGWGYPPVGHGPLA